MKNCPVCKQEKEKLEKHHLNYTKNVTIEICKPCNIKIAKNKNYAPEFNNVDERPKKGIRISEETYKQLKETYQKQNKINYPSLKNFVEKKIIELITNNTKQ